MQKQIAVPEVHCNHCVQSIEGAVGPLDGVTSVRVDLDSRTVAVDYDDTVVAHADIVAAIEDQGYEVPDGDEPQRLPLA